MRVNSISPPDTTPPDRNSLSRKGQKSETKRIFNKRFCIRFWKSNIGHTPLKQITVDTTLQVAGNSAKNTKKIKRNRFKLKSSFSCLKWLSRLFSKKPNNINKQETTPFNRNDPESIMGKTTPEATQFREEMLKIIIGEDPERRTMRDLIDDGTMKPVLLESSRSDLKGENIEAYIAFTKFADRCDAGSADVPAQQAAIKIFFNRFISDSAEKQINISYKYKTKMFDLFKAAEGGTLAQATFTGYKGETLAGFLREVANCLVSGHKLFQNENQKTSFLNATEVLRE